MAARDYDKPELIDFGSLTDLTQSMSVLGAEGAVGFGLALAQDSTPTGGS